jgi:cytoskeletal protein CcmA (bactofilin family)
MAMKGDNGGTDRQITYIGPGAKIVGELHGSLEVLVDGKVEGRLQGNREVIVGPSGKVKGSIEASTVRISGHVEGDVIARERVELVGEGHLEGEIVAPKLVIEPGAFFKGEVDVAGEGSPAQESKGSTK